MALTRQNLLVEFGPAVGGGSSGSQPRGVTGVIPNVASARFTQGLFRIDPKKERDRLKAQQRRRERLRELVREWIKTSDATLG